MESTARKGCNVGMDTTGPVSASDQSRNMRKFQTDTPPPSNVTGFIPLQPPQNDSSTYEFSTETFEMPPSQGQPLPSSVNLSKVHQGFSPDRLKLDLGLPSQFNVGQGVTQQPRGEIVGTDEVQLATWSHPGEAELAKLAISNLDVIFKSAIRKLVSYGYPEKIATEAVLLSDICYGSEDLITAIVENTLTVIRRTEGSVDLTTTDHNHNYLKELESLEKDVLSEMVYVLRGVCPLFSVGDAIWCLLLCDMNITCACTTDPEGFSGLSDERRLSRTSAYSKPKENEDSRARGSGVSLSGGSASSLAVLPSHLPPAEEEHSSPSLSLTGGLNLEDSSLSLKSFKKSVSSSNPQHSDNSINSKRVLSSINKRDSVSRQRYLLEKIHKKHGRKGSSGVGKLISQSGSSVSDKKLKPQRDSNSKSLKMASLKITGAVGVAKVSQEINSCISLINVGPSTAASLNSQTDVQASELLKTNAGATPVLLTSSVSHTSSGTNTETSLSLATTSNTKPVTMGTKDDIPTGSITGALFDKSSDQLVAQDKKEAIILYLTYMAKDLNNQVKEWNDWAAQKVMQATRRLSKDSDELKMLRQEKEGVKQPKKKRNLEKRVINKLAKMEVGMCNAREQYVLANSAIQRLESENAAVRREMEVAELYAVESAAKLEEALNREKSTMKKFQSWEEQKVSMQEELAMEKVKLEKLLKEVERAKIHKNQIEARCRQEEKEKEDLLAQGTQIRKEREQIEASTKSKGSVIELEADSIFHRCKEDIQKLKKDISKLKLKIDSSKIAALNSSTATTASKPILDFKDRNYLKRERECVMCLSEEACVVFVPCAHQVVCMTCNELHEKKGMKDCPSCRSTIRRRIAIRYAHSS
ncbi:hypothetical protein SAY87_010690 [Trapa incisa]|uniref:RING-type domain-containing protein n=1 Tax=Trapa incisa TaxID=236973 RepID=A0AAN7GPV5_9MYRT|nr:hypothetical protein SAY87_010690 [Trapa incisa]